MIVAGIGSRRGVTRQQVLDAVAMALQTHGLTPSDLSALATAGVKRSETAIVEAGAALGVGVTFCEGDELTGAIAKTMTRSAASLAFAGTPSVSEAAALAAAGDAARLLGPRIVAGPVTCALAVGDERP